MKSLFPPKDKFAAYLLGLYAASGYKRSNNRWSIFQNDELFLNKIAAELNQRDIEVRVDKKTRDSWQLIVNSKEDVDFLHANGLGSNKSYFAGPVSIEREFFAYFLIGLIDGDGNIDCSSKKPRIRIYSGAKSLITWVVRFANDIGITILLSEQTRKPRESKWAYPLFTARINDSSDIVRLLCLSNKLNGLVLRRKWDKLQEGLKDYQGSRVIKRMIPKPRRIEKITYHCQYCGKEIKRLRRQARDHTPTCSDCFAKRFLVIKTCKVCDSEFATTLHEKLSICPPCREAKKSQIKAEKKAQNMAKWSETCSHCGADLIRKEKNKSKIYLCPEHSKYAYLYTSSSEVP